MLQILQKQVDESTFCPLCQASMYWIEAEQYNNEMFYHECTHCKHQVFSEQKYNCYCEKCSAKRKMALQQTRSQEKLAIKKNTVTERELSTLNFLNKLFLLSLLDDLVKEDQTYTEFIDWNKIKYHYITPNYLCQNHLFKRFIYNQILVEKSSNEENSQAYYYVHVRLDGYSEPSLFSITQQLRHWFYENLTLGTPFQNTDEVKSALYYVLYQEIIQFMQFYCKNWHIKIAGNKAFQAFCYQLLDVLSVGQIYYLIQNALDFLHQKNALHTQNENFINTNLLKKTLQQYREKSIANKWETFALPRPTQLPLSKMSEILLFRFLGYDEKIFMQPIRHSWQKILPRLDFYAKKRCMHCGSADLSVEYDAENYVSLFCHHCKRQDHYFTS